MKHAAIFAIAALLAGPALAGDPAKGESEYKKCKSCHAIIAPDGTEIQKGGKTGPNLWGVVGRPVASVEGFKYGPSILAVGESGKVWDEASLVEYAKDPAAWLKTTLDDSGAKSKMTFKLPKGADDVVAYLATMK
ncbi:MAG: cytochrome C [Rhodobacteraceae bacterium]|jgi:cytochrome c|nr:cytochrome C [Paracoccaceae bacterium]